MYTYLYISRNTINQKYIFLHPKFKFILFNKIYIYKKFKKRKHFHGLTSSIFFLKKKKHIFSIHKINLSKVGGAPSPGT